MRYARSFFEGVGFVVVVSTLIVAILVAAGVPGYKACFFQFCIGEEANHE